VRRLEALPREVTQLRGRTPATIDTHEGPVRFRIDPWKGQKTGAFLDQRENRLATAAYARGRVLDAFAYHGSFAMHAAAGAASVVIVDASADALARARLHVEMNQAHDVTLCEANVFDDLRHRVRRGETFDTIFLDPPAFAKSRADLDAARRGYKEIHVRALQLLASGGTLVTSSCSYNLLEPDWIQVVTSAAQDVHRAARVTEKRGQARDHPIRLGFPESQYLKCLALNCP
jgi:23S rRNA (cytosine1962-C5)-methyltransferase